MESPIKRPECLDGTDTLTVRQAAGIKEKDQFGIEKYVTPHHGAQRRVASFAPSKSPNVNMYDLIAKQNKWKTGPKTQHWDWSANMAKLPGKMGKYKKVTHTAQIMTEHKDRVAPSKYDPSPAYKRKTKGAMNL